MPRRIVMAGVLALGLSGCYYGPYGITADPLIGAAALGAAAGAIGGAVVGRPGTGAAVGAASGAFLGAASAATRRHYGYGPSYYGPSYHAPRPRYRPRYRHPPPYPYYGPPVSFNFSYSRYR